MVDTDIQLEGLTVRIDLVDMEGYALKKVCDHLNVEFHCYKNVSDSANSDADEDWSNNVSNGVTLFKEMLHNKYGVSQLTAGTK